MTAPCLVIDQHGVALRQLLTVKHRRTSILSRTQSTVSHTLKALAEVPAEARRKAREYDELTAMSDPELQDIGISRGDILAVVTGVYRSRRYPVSDPALNEGT